MNTKSGLQKTKYRTTMSSLCSKARSNKFLFAVKTKNQNSEEKWAKPLTILKRPWELWIQTESEVKV